MSVRTIIAGAAMAVAMWAITAAASETTTYTYDARGRLVKVVRDRSSDDDWAVDITYDAAGNRTNYASTNTTTTPGGNPPGGGEPPDPPTYSVQYRFNGRFFVLLVKN